MKTYKKSWPGNLCQLPTLTFDPSFSVKWGYLTTTALYCLYFSYVTDTKAGDNCCDSSHVISETMKPTLIYFVKGLEGYI